MKQSQSHEPFFSGKPGAICRRDFLISGVKASLCFIACDALAFPASAGQPAASLPHNIDDSLHIIANYLTGYTPPAGSFPADGAWKATYDLVNRGPREGAAFGHLAVTRRAGSEGSISYDTVYGNKLFDFVTTMKSTMQCSSGRLPRLIEWTTDYETHLQPYPPTGFLPDSEYSGVIAVPSSVPPMTLCEHGRHRDGALEISSPFATRKVKTARPVVPQWAVLDALRNAKADPSDPMAGIEFDLLHNLTSYRPHQILKPSGVLDITMAGGKSQSFHGFYQTGVGSEPTNYWIDSQGRPLFMTEGLISAALTAIAPD